MNKKRYTIVRLGQGRILLDAVNVVGGTVNAKKIVNHGKTILKDRVVIDIVDYNKNTDRSYNAFSVTGSSVFNGDNAHFKGGIVESDSAIIAKSKIVLENNQHICSVLPDTVTMYDNMGYSDEEHKLLGIDDSGRIRVGSGYYDKCAKYDTLIEGGKRVFIRTSSINEVIPEYNDSEKYPNKINEYAGSEICLSPRSSTNLRAYDGNRTANVVYSYGHKISQPGASATVDATIDIFENGFYDNDCIVSYMYIGRHSGATEPVVTSTDANAYLWWDTNVNQMKVILYNVTDNYRKLQKYRYILPENAYNAYHGGTEFTPTFTDSSTGKTYTMYQIFNAITDTIASNNELPSDQISREILSSSNLFNQIAPSNGEPKWFHILNENMYIYKFFQKDSNLRALSDDDDTPYDEMYKNVFTSLNSKMPGKNVVDKFPAPEGASISNDVAVCGYIYPYYDSSKDYHTELLDLYTGGAYAGIPTILQWDSTNTELNRLTEFFKSKDGTMYSININPGASFLVCADGTMTLSDNSTIDMKMNEIWTITRPIVNDTLFDDITLTFKGSLSSGFDNAWYTSSDRTSGECWVNTSSSSITIDSSVSGAASNVTVEPGEFIVFVTNAGNEGVMLYPSSINLISCLKEPGVLALNTNDSEYMSLRNKAFDKADELYNFLTSYERSVVAGGANPNIRTKYIAITSTEPSADSGLEYVEISTFYDTNVHRLFKDAPDELGAINASYSINYYVYGSEDTIADDERLDAVYGMYTFKTRFLQFISSLTSESLYGYATNYLNGIIMNDLDDGNPENLNFRFMCQTNMLFEPWVDSNGITILNSVRHSNRFIDGITGGPVGFPVGLTETYVESGNKGIKTSVNVDGKTYYYYFAEYGLPVDSVYYTGNSSLDPIDYPIKSTYPENMIGFEYFATKIALSVDLFASYDKCIYLFNTYGYDDAIAKVRESGFDAFLDYQSLVFKFLSTPLSEVNSYIGKTPSLSSTGSLIDIKVDSDGKFNGEQFVDEMYESGKRNRPTYVFDLIEDYKSVNVNNNSENHFVYFNLRFALPKDITNNIYWNELNAAFVLYLNIVSPYSSRLTLNYYGNDTYKKFSFHDMLIPIINQFLINCKCGMMYIKSGGDYCSHNRMGIFSYGDIGFSEGRCFSQQVTPNYSINGVAHRTTQRTLMYMDKFGDTVDQALIDKGVEGKLVRYGIACAEVFNEVRIGTFASNGQEATNRLGVPFTRKIRLACPPTISNWTYTSDTSGTLRYALKGSDGKLYAGDPISSSKRYKIHIDHISNARGAEIINSLTPAEFKYKNQPDSPYYGFYAEDVEQIDKNLVRYNESNEPDSLKYNSIIALLVSAYKDEREKREKLEERLERLEAIINEK